MEDRKRGPTKLDSILNYVKRCELIDIINFGFVSSIPSHKTFILSFICVGNLIIMCISS